LFSTICFQRVPDQPSIPTSDSSLPFRIIAESSSLIIIDKPPFLQVHPSKPSHRRTLWDELRGLLAFEIACGGQISIINRLDRETSGLTLVAKTREAARELSMQMAGRRISKEYLALVWGWPAEDDWIVDAPILRKGERLPSRIHLKQMVHPEGALSRTRFHVEYRFGDAGAFAIVRAVPETGRMHQIRVHLSHSGHPVVGDKIYGPDEGCYLEFIETGWTSALQQRLLLPRHALHSSRLRLEGTGEEWHSPLAPDLDAFVKERCGG
jgi:23S rRNA pseudouridine1911/1915/1917 synthase